MTLIVPDTVLGTEVAVKRILPTKVPKTYILVIGTGWGHTKKQVNKKV